MKYILAVGAAICSVASAWPLLPWLQLAPPAPGTQFYQLQAKSATTAVNNQWVTLPTSSSSYGLATAQTAATKFFVQKYNATNTWAFHNADDTRQLALRGPDGVLLYLIDVTNPNAGNIPGGQLMEWATFTMDNNILGVNDGSTLKNRTFVAVSGTGASYTLALYDGVSSTTQAITPVTLNLVRSGST
ncbi:hypothetical protein FB567DRAFT_507812 [Paraphoma chrysanthemicola]|uniref:Uncharacterized protein n=1 Tax=Paraphoma chrysanthemicola TaxID=798071 RepID=A0A8K0QTP9_9PLEO|nr:hypothetical protein FB567DRAFT_507812 [Paraphoma chrysanthemicola]